MVLVRTFLILGGAGCLIWALRTAASLVYLAMWIRNHSRQYHYYYFSYMANPATEWPKVAMLAAVGILLVWIGLNVAKKTS